MPVAEEEATFLLLYAEKRHTQNRNGYIKIKISSGHSAQTKHTVAWFATAQYSLCMSVHVPLECRLKEAKTVHKNGADEAYFP